MFRDDAIFWVEVHKIHPNPYQPRREFDEGKLRDLSDSIRQYGVLQPLVVTRRERYDEAGNMMTDYELIAGERRLRAARLAGLAQVPVVIKSNADDENIKLELAIIENVQREDLNPIDRARAFAQLAQEFGHKHTEIGKKIGKSREYVSNSIRILALPEEMLSAIAEGRMKEGHSRPLLMLSDRPDEQRTLFKDILQRQINVRDAELISRRIAVERARIFDQELRPEVREFEEVIGGELGTRVHVQKNKKGGKVVINFVTDEDLDNIMARLHKRFAREQQAEAMEEESEETTGPVVAEPVASEEVAPPYQQKKEKGEEDDSFAIDNFSI